MFPGTVAMSKVRQDPKSEVQKSDNLRILQQAFNTVVVYKVQSNPKPKPNPPPPPPHPHPPRAEDPDF